MHMDVFSVRLNSVCEIVANRCCVGPRGETGQELCMEFLFEVYMRSSLQKALREEAFKNIEESSPSAFGEAPRGVPDGDWRVLGRPSASVFS